MAIRQRLRQPHDRCDIEYDLEKILRYLRHVPVSGANNAKYQGYPYQIKRNEEKSDDGYRNHRQKFIPAEIKQDNWQYDQIVRQYYPIFPPDSQDVREQRHLYLKDDTLGLDKRDASISDRRGNKGPHHEACGQKRQEFLHRRAEKQTENQAHGSYEDSHVSSQPEGANS